MQSTFYAKWQSQFSHVTIPREPRQAKCDVCTSLKSILGKTSTPQQIKGEVKMILEAHRQTVVQERHLYWIRREMAVANSSMFFSFVMDGMDQSVSNLPNYHPRIRKLLPIAEFHVFGVLNHVRDKPHFFICHDGIRKDSNLSISAFLWSIMSEPQPWPPVLFLQVRYLQI